MSAGNIAGHHAAARFAMIAARVINNVCFNVNLRRGSNLISTEATRSNADGDWLGGIARRNVEVNVERNVGGARRKSGSSSGREQEERKEEGEREKERMLSGEEKEEEGGGGGRRTQEGPLGIVRGRSLVTRDSCDPDDP